MNHKHNYYYYLDSELQFVGYTWNQNNIYIYVMDSVLSSSYLQECNEDGNKKNQDDRYLVL